MIDLFKPVFPHTHCSKCGAEFTVYNYIKQRTICRDCYRDQVMWSLRDRRDGMNPSRKLRPWRMR
jgi:hypothetical protein